ncbi:MAG: hypothetical protein MJ135_06855 [Oscillospiraceae bacterium]|nr:hypothetical protein [Oscillospiraceae bacterium]
MNRTARDRRQYAPRPVKRIELDEPQPLRKLLVIGLALAVAVSSLCYAVSQLLTPSAGWQTIDYSGSELSAEADFVLQYELGKSSLGATAERKQLSLLYAGALEEGYRLFTPGAEPAPGEGTLHTVNTHPNEPVAVSPALYSAFAQLEAAGSRALTLAPVYEEYTSLFASSSDAEAAAVDPALDPDAAAFTAQAAAYAADASAIRLELLGQDRVQLHVSPEYAAWCAENGVVNYLDFAFLRNAFLADFIAGRLSEAGFTHGALTSREGYIRSLEDRAAVDYDWNLYAPSDGSVLCAARVVLPGGSALVTLRSFAALSGEDAYCYDDGSWRFAAIAPDGLCRANCSSMTLISPQHGCAQLLLELLPRFQAEELSFAGLSAKGITALACTGDEILTNSPDLQLNDLYASDRRSFSLRVLSDSCLLSKKIPGFLAGSPGYLILHLLQPL